VSKTIKQSTVAENLASPLCYKCRHISVDTVFACGRDFHSDRLVDVIRSASTCRMCDLMRHGLLAAIADKSEGDTFVDHESINIRPYVSDISIEGASSRAGLRVWIISTDATCLLNWYLPRNGLYVLCPSTSNHG
jgi:hypothetical protein